MSILPPIATECPCADWAGTFVPARIEERRPATEDDGIPGCAEYIDYALEETPDARLESALAGEAAALERIAELEARLERLHDEIGARRCRECLDAKAATAREGR